MPAYTSRTDTGIHEARGGPGPRISLPTLRPRIVPCPAEELTLRQYIDHLKVVDGDETTWNLEDNRTLFWLWVWWRSPAARRVWVANAEKSEG